MNDKERPPLSSEVFFQFLGDQLYFRSGERQFFGHDYSKRNDYKLMAGTLARGQREILICFDGLLPFERCIRFLESILFLCERKRLRAKATVKTFYDYGGEVVPNKFRNKVLISFEPKRKFENTQDEPENCQAIPEMVPPLSPGRKTVLPGDEAPLEHGPGAGPAQTQDWPGPGCRIGTMSAGPSPSPEPTEGKPGIRNYRQLAHAMLLTFERLGYDQTARIDARKWWVFYQAILERLDKESVRFGRNPGKG